MKIFAVCCGQLAPFDPTKKKKKKKVVIQESADDAVDKLAENTENLSGVGLCSGYLLLEIDLFVCG